MFSRRTIQGALDVLGAAVSKSVVKQIVGRLNGPLHHQSGGEWEAVVVAAFLRVSELRHEGDLGGRSRVDVLASFADPPVVFLADVTAVSDAGLEEENPVALLHQEIFQTARDLGSTGAGLVLDVRARAARAQSKRPVLALPKKSDIPRFVRESVRPFLVQVAAHPSTNRRIRFDDGFVDLTLSYRASEKTLSYGSWPNYTPVLKGRNNPLLNRLREKSTQAGASGFRGICGIIVCDAGCEAISSAREAVVAAFFKSKPRVSFVAILAIPDAHTQERGRPRLKTTMTFHWNPMTNPQAAADVNSALKKMVAEITPALSPSRYALSRKLMPRRRRDNAFIGSGIESHADGSERIRVSARAVADALAGASNDDARLGHSLPVSVLLAQIREGRRIRGVRFEASPHDDDDWIVFDFDGPDPAVSPFTPPR